MTLTNDVGTTKALLRADIRVLNYLCINFQKMAAYFLQHTETSDADDDAKPV